MSPEFYLICETKHPHSIRVLPVDNEFREVRCVIGFRDAQEKIWEEVTKRGRDCQL